MAMQSWIRPVLTLFLVLMLAACTTPGGAMLPDLPDWQSRQIYLAKTEEWEFSGRIGVSAGDDGFNGKLWWRQDGPVFRARMSGPLGVGTIFINGDHGEMTLTDQDGVVTELRDAEAELRQRYGWTIPVQSLRYWALGIPDPATPAETEFDAEGQLASLSQGGWTVSITQYADGGGQSMPRRLTAINDDIRVRLVVDQWTFRRLPRG